MDGSTEESRARVLARLAEPDAESNLILKKEPLGVSVGDSMVNTVKGMLANPDQNFRDHLLMEKIHAKVTDAPVSFIRDHAVRHVGLGIQEIGMYGSYFRRPAPPTASAPSDTLRVRCGGYLVRTKPEHEADGGVCKGIAVLDSLAA